MKSKTTEVLRKYFNAVPELDALIQWASNPTSYSAGYGLEENYSFIRSNLMERYLISAKEAERYIQMLRNEMSSLTTLGYDIGDLRKGILEEASLSGIWTKTMKEKLEHSSPEAKKASFLLLYLKTQGYFRLNPCSEYEMHSFEMDSWVQFLMRFRTFFLAAYGQTFSKSIEEELFKVGLWNKLWYKPCRSPGKIEIVMVPLPMLEELNFNEADTILKADVKPPIEQLFRDCRFERLALVDEITKTPFGIRQFKQEIPTIDGIVAINGNEGYEVAISPFFLEQVRESINTHKQKMIQDYSEKIESALTQLCDEKWPECESTCKAKGHQSFWRIDFSTYSQLYVYLTPWLTEADLNALFPDKDINAIFIVLTQPIPAIKRLLLNKIAGFRYLEILLPSEDCYQHWKATGERFGYTDRIIELIEGALTKKADSAHLTGSYKPEGEKLEHVRLLPSILDQDESQRLEFKSSLRYDVKASEYGQNKVNPELEREVLKEVCAFLNTDGGLLVIGVTDDKKVLGLKNDYQSFSRKQNRDEFESFLRNKLTQNIQPDIPGLVKITFEPYGDQEVCIVEVLKSGESMFLRDVVVGREIQELWIREGNRKRALVGAAMAAYIRRHWSGR